MQPSAGDRLVLAGIFFSLAIITPIAAWAASRRATRFRSLRGVVLLMVAAASLALVTVAVGVTARMMFISVHDFRLVLVLLGFGAALGALLAIAVTNPLAHDLRRIVKTARAATRGKHDTRTSVRRLDEVGEAARALDEMVDRLAEAEEERQRNDRARREFLAAVGHDLRTPITALQVAVEALTDGVAPDPDRYLNGMQRHLRSLRSLVEDLFTLARIESGHLQIEFERLDLTEVIDEVVESLTPVAERAGVTLKLCAESQNSVMGGAAELGRVIQNLVDNAIRFAPAATDVFIEAGPSDAGLLVRVIDQGPGIPEELRAQAFHSFVKADPARTQKAGGAGLGLAVARGLVEAHGGRIWIEDGPGGRLAFSIPESPPDPTPTEK